MAGEKAGGVTSARGVLLYNPARLAKGELKRLFLLRRDELEQLLARVRAAGHSVPHVLVFGDRGMGKTTLLHRLAIAVEEDESLSRSWHPVLLDEEQYNLAGLDAFWLNCLETLAEEERRETGRSSLFDAIDQLAKPRNPARTLAEAALDLLHRQSRETGRGFLLLVDNFDLLLERIGDQDRRLREILQHDTWLMLVAATPEPLTFDYGHPFYDFFQILPLEAIRFEEAYDFLLQLADLLEAEPAVLAAIKRKRGLLKALHALMGGNLRAVTALFTVIAREPEARLPILLDFLLDQYTSFYKDIVDNLPSQAQLVLDGLARAWDPTTAEEIAQDQRIERGTASAQLHRLADRGHVRKVQLAKRRLGFQIRDRFFNLWYLMRGGRRQRAQLTDLVDFLELFCEPRRSRRQRRRLLTLLEDLQMIESEAVERIRGKTREDFEQRPLPGLHGTDAWKEEILVLYLQDRLEESLAQARNLGEVTSETTFARIVSTQILSELEQCGPALEMLDTAGGEPAQPWIQLERIRLLLQLGRLEEIPKALIPFGQFAEIPPAEVAELARDLVEQGGPSLSWMAPGLLQEIRTRGDADVGFLLTAAEIELALRHPEQAIENYQKGLKAFRQSGLSPHEGILDTTLKLARELPKEVHAALKETGLATMWKPVEHALAFLSGEQDRLELLSPEMKLFTEDVLERIRQTGQPT